MMNQGKNAIPEWMLTEENYIPTKDRDGFIRKSMLKILGVLSRARHDGRAASDGISAPWKLAFTILCIVLMSLSRNMFFTYVILAIFLVRMMLLPGKMLGKVLGPAVAAAVLSAILLIPAIFMGNPQSMLMISIKVFISVGWVNVMAVTTPWNRITQGLRFYHVPGIFIFTFDMTLKYIVILGDLACNMLEALRLRSVGKNQEKGKSLSGVMGVTFLKSREMAEETYGAMMCRGFEGEYPIQRGTRWIAKKDAVIFVMMAAVIVIFVYLR